MKEYTIQIEDDVDTKLQYLADTSLKTQTPVSISGNTVQEILQFIIDDKVNHIILVADTTREKELIEAVKSDAKLYADAIAMANTIKTAASKEVITKP